MATAPLQEPPRVMRTFAEDLLRAREGTKEPLPPAPVEEVPRVTVPAVPKPAPPPKPPVTPPPTPKPPPPPLPKPVLPKPAPISIPKPPAPARIPRRIAEELDAATIVTDVKAERWSLFRAIGKAFTGWWNKPKTSRVKPMPKPTAPPPPAPVEEVPRVTVPAAPRPTPPPAPIPPPPMPVPPPPPPRPVNTDLVERLRAAVPPPQPVMSAPLVTPEIPTLPEEQLPIQSRKRGRPTLHIDGTDTQVAALDVPPPEAPAGYSYDPEAAAALESEIADVPEPEPIQTLDEMPTEQPSTIDLLRQQAVERRQTAIQPGSGGSKGILATGAVVVIIFIIATTAAIIYFVLRDGVGQDNPTVETPDSQLFVPAISEPIPLSTNRDTLMAELTRVVRDASGTGGTFAYYYLHYPSDANKTPLPAQAFTDALALRAPGTLLRTIGDTMMFGAYIAVPNQPYVVFQVRSRTDAFAGMLAWEQTINADLAPLFGPDVARQNGAAPSFTDEIINRIDVRALYDTSGQLVLLYGFVDSDTLVITTSKDAFVALTEQLR